MNTDDPTTENSNSTPPSTLENKKGRAARKRGPSAEAQAAMNDLRKEAEDWLPATEAGATPEILPTSERPRTEIETSESTEFVTMIHDPFHLPLPEGRADTEEDFDESDESEYESDDEDTENADDLDDGELQSLSPEDVEQAFAGIATAIAEEDKKLASEIVELNAESAQELTERLAKEIAEDEALAAAIVAETEAHAELHADDDIDLDADIDPSLATPVVLDLQELQGNLEALLFMSEKPLTAEKLHELLGPDQPFSLFQEAMTAVKDRYQTQVHGIEVVEVSGGYQLRTKISKAGLARKLSRIQVQRLSSGAMETLAIIAFKQPLLKEEIDKIRGVDSSHFVRTLLDRKLVCISGRSDLPGRPMLYTTTPEFLELFGLKDLNDLPPLRELEAMIPASESNNPENEDPRVREMRKLVSQMKSDVSTTLNYDPKEDERILKDIRERVNSIPTSTPYLELQKELAKQAEQGLTNPAEPLQTPQATQPELALEPQAEVVDSDGHREITEDSSASRDSLET